MPKSATHGLRAENGFEPGKGVAAVSVYWEGETHTLTDDDFKKLHEVVRDTGSEVTQEDVRDIATGVAGLVYDVKHNLAGAMPAGEQVEAVKIIFNLIRRIEKKLGLHSLTEQDLRLGEQNPIVLVKLAERARRLTGILDRPDAASTMTKKKESQSKKLRALGIGGPFNGDPRNEPLSRANAVHGVILNAPMLLRALRIACKSFLEDPPNLTPRKPTLPMRNTFIRHVAKGWQSLTDRRAANNRLFKKFAEIIAKGIGLRLSDNALRGLIDRFARKQV